MLKSQGDTFTAEVMYISSTAFQARLFVVHWMQREPCTRCGTLLLQVEETPAQFHLFFGGAAFQALTLVGSHSSKHITECRTYGWGMCAHPQNVTRRCPVDRFPSMFLSRSLNENSIEAVYVGE